MVDAGREDEALRVTCLVIGTCAQGMVVLVSDIECSEPLHPPENGHKREFCVVCQCYYEKHTDMSRRSLIFQGSSLTDVGALNAMRWNDTMRDLSKEFHDFQKAHALSCQLMCPDPLFEEISADGLCEPCH
eukprot:2929892-Amphidinium_carterae.1